MSDEDRRDSLADQAAAWVPPWERPRPPAAEPDTAEAASDVTAPSPATDDLAAQPPVQEPEPAALPGDLDRAESDRTESGRAEPDRAESDRAESDRGEPEPGEPFVGESSEAAGVPRRQAAGRRRVTAAPEPAPELSDTELRGALEAILLVVDEPVSELVLAQVLEQRAERVGPVLDEIAAGYTAAGHGFELRRAAGGWRLYTRPEYATYVERFVLDGQSVRLTQAALETLAVVAYKQPVTRSRISAIRGVNCDGVIRTLVTRGLVEECGTETDSGAFLYKTTTLFLEKLGLNTVDELPPLAPFLPDDVEELADATR
ncbi:segregation and condensation protein B [Micromonospora sp. A202]|uniref:SMC-Scp complex subunit ScpB n=1 Tax=Micromonospora sp. A202 TaxID=2572899 RepID=UPI00114E3AD7|nr:SMC-Scp complex subunit ScpB [Micromonospora sp. A202]TQJ21918.1 segregation and condensation protein B [Micromonospora sp. A202]